MQNLKVNEKVGYTKSGYYSKKSVKAVCEAIQNELKKVKKCDELTVEFLNETIVVSFERNWKPVYSIWNTWSLVVWFSTSDDEGNDYCTTAYCSIEKGKIDWEYSEVENEKC